jgi:phenylpyruvate tautomerase PptA (4-oxalocrotonate tautomerase family)
MPTVKIELLKGKDHQSLKDMMTIVMDTVVEVLQLPSDDRNMRLWEYEPGFFEMKTPYQVLVEICMFAGRTKETKKKLYQTIVNRLEEKQLFAKEQVFIIIHEPPMENWGVRGGIPANELKLGFKVEV